MAISVNPSAKDGIIMKKGCTDRLFCSGISGGVQSDGSESWTVQLSGSYALVEQAVSGLGLGMPATMALSGVKIPSRNTPYLLGWKTATKPGDVGTLDLTFGIERGKDVEFVDGARRVYTQNVESFEEDASILDVDSFWKDTAGEDKAKRSGFWAAATLLSSLIMNGTTVERFPEWQSFTKDLTGTKYSTIPEFLAALPKDLMSRLQAGLVTQRVGGLVATFTETSKGAGSAGLYDIGEKRTPPIGKLTFPKNLSWEVLSDSSSYSSAAGETTRTTVYRGVREDDGEDE